MSRLVSYGCPESSHVTSSMGGGMQVLTTPPPIPLFPTGTVRVPRLERDELRPVRYSRELTVPMLRGARGMLAPARPKLWVSHAPGHSVCAGGNGRDCAQLVPMQVRGRRRRERAVQRTASPAGRTSRTSGRGAAQRRRAAWRVDGATGRSGAPPPRRDRKGASATRNEFAPWGRDCPLQFRGGGG